MNPVPYLNKFDDIVADNGYLLIALAGLAVCLGVYLSAFAA